MKNAKGFLTKWWFYVILLVLTLSVPGFINLAYLIGSRVGAICETVWTGADVLSFYGSYLSFVGTLVLGVVAIFQNIKVHQLNEQLLKLQQAEFVPIVSINRLEISRCSSSTPNYRNPNMAELELVDLTAETFESPQNYHVDIEFENESEYPIVEIIAHGGPRKSAAGMLMGLKQNLNRAIHIAPHERAQFRFIIPCEIFDVCQNYGLVLTLYFVNIFDYGLTSSVHLSDLRNPGKKNEYFYRLAKFTDIRPK